MRHKASCTCPLCTAKRIRRNEIRERIRLIKSWGMTCGRCGYLKLSAGYLICDHEFGLSGCLKRTDYCSNWKG